MSSNVTTGAPHARQATETVTEPPRPPKLVRLCAHLAKSAGFNLGVVVVILLNAAALGIATYPSVAESYGTWLTALERFFLLVFVAELAIRMIAHGRRPQDFFRNGWNVFDFLVVAAAFVPGLAANATLLRMARLARVVRVVRFFPALRTILIGVAKSLPGLGGFLALSGLMIYLYGMLGWLLFGDIYPDDYGTAGRAVLTLFLLLSLETLPDAIAQGLEVGSWTLLYFISYVLIASYLLVNVLIGVVINSMEETRQAELAERLRENEDADLDAELDREAVAQRVEDLRQSLQRLEAELRLRRD